VGARECIGVVGGTGQLGRGLALRFAAVGYGVLVGSRTPARARTAVEEIRDRLTAAAAPPAGPLAGVANADAVAGADLVVLTVPYAAVDALASILRAIGPAGILVDTVVPLCVRDDEIGVARPPEGSASLHLRGLLPAVPVVAAFKTVAAATLQDLTTPLAGDLLLAGDDRAALERVGAVVARLGGLVPRTVGTLACAGLLESLAALEINLRRRYGGRAHFRLGGVGDAD
jgi:hypothetical protein